MTEDDTFRRLSRISFYELMKLYRTTAKDSSRNWYKWFEEYGWTWEEFCNHWREWNGATDTYSDFERSRQ